MSRIKKHEIPIPGELLSKYRMKGITFKAFNYLKKDREVVEIKIEVDYDTVLEEVKRPQAVELWREGLSYGGMKKIYDSHFDIFREKLEELGMKATPEAKRIITNFTFYMTRVMLNADLLRKELFEE